MKPNKSILIAILIICIATIPVTAYPTENTNLTIPRPIPGDVTDDGKVNINDATLLFNYVAFPNERGTTYVITRMYNADVNGDGTVNIGDAVLLFNYVSYPNERGTTYILQ